MPRRKQILATDETYHIFNRAVGHDEIFTLKWDLNRILALIDYYRFPQKIRYSKFRTLPQNLKRDYPSQIKKQTPLVEIYSFSLMPNHYHLLGKQLQNKGINIFISNIQNSFAKFYNLRNNRHGTLFQNPFKARRVETEEEFIHVSRYIHLNPVTSFVIELSRLDTYPWTSLSWYLDESRNKFITTNLIKGIFKTKEKYLEFIVNQADYQRKLGVIKHLMIE